ncbi:MAG: biotin--[acetyl-CoA-carboxylase] ligase [Flavobacteriaceae bacterium]|nr:biotin--[acetyl-CoA-carboxylase] ligase [Flavobacteriaceae bacterium]
MNIIKLSAISSTNDYLKDLIAVKELDNYTAIITPFQTKGRGQMGSTWVSEFGKNLITSILIKDISLTTSNRFYLSMAVSLAVVSAIEQKTRQSFSIKWPNDILSARKKIAGILIENTINEGQIRHSIVGIGLNLNQMKFKNLPNASSVKKCTGKEITPKEMLKEILKQLPHYIKYIEEKNYETLQTMYLEKLYRFNRPTMFSSNGKIFLGKIITVSPQGKLVIELENHQQKKFTIKEVDFAK